VFFDAFYSSYLPARAHWAMTGFPWKEMLGPESLLLPRKEVQLSVLVNSRQQAGVCLLAKALGANERIQAGSVEGVYENSPVEVISQRICRSEPHELEGHRTGLCQETGPSSWQARRIPAPSPAVGGVQLEAVSHRLDVGALDLGERGRLPM
jgi:hypothetical protein